MKLKLAHVLLVLFGILSIAVFALAVRGIPGNPTESSINLDQWKNNGPFELSPDRGRFALTMSVIENNSFFFSLPIARFATPDLGYKNGNYVSLFAPAVSYIIIPGYLIGKQFGLAQAGSFAIISFFAIINGFLIIGIAKKLGANTVASILAAIAFLFASPAFTYGVTLYQHHISTFLILSSIYVLLSWNSVWSLSLIWFMCAASIPVDYPNLFLMLPIGFYALGKLIFVTKTEKKTTVHIKVLGFLTFITVLLPLAYFMWFNQMSYGNPLQFSGTVAGVKAIDANGRPADPELIDANNAEKYLNPDSQKKSAIGFFLTRNFVNGLYIHLLSPDRGIIRFTPVMLIALVGLFILYQTSPGLAALLFGVFAFDLALYSMWGDPWGGWAFGSRYLIPGYAMLSLFIAVALTYWKRFRIVLLSLFFVLLTYSIAVNTLGAITSSRNPPQVEVLALEKLSHRQEKYSWDRDLDILLSNQSKSFVWQTYGKPYLSAPMFYLIIVALIVIPSLGLTTLLAFTKKGVPHEIQ